MEPSALVYGGPPFPGMGFRCASGLALHSHATQEGLCCSEYHRNVHRNKREPQVVKSLQRNGNVLMKGYEQMPTTSDLTVPAIIN